MRYSINIPNLGDFAGPWVVAEVARLAEESGWDGLFIWNHLIGYNQDLVADSAATSILLAAVALATTRIRLGTQVTPVPRRRPNQLAREIATLDRLSGGRRSSASAWAIRLPTSTAGSASRPRPRFWPGCWMKAWTRSPAGVRRAGLLPRPVRHGR
jgi:hypothetical protein